MMRTLFACYFERYWQLFLVSVVRGLTDHRVKKLITLGTSLVRRKPDSVCKRR
ncbi:hypothetical protein [Glycocaulis sp.]|uniref:hypothetical protein n=1 Tax=Glycocaulis sp. TaxID=1969725 RepID=UPI003D1D4C73